MGKRIVMADDVTGEFSGVVKTKTLAQINDHPKTINGLTSEGRRLALASNSGVVYADNGSVAPLIITAGGLIPPNNYLGFAPETDPTSKMVFAVSFVPPRSGTVDRIVMHWSRGMTGGTALYYSALHPCQTNGSPNLNSNIGGITIGTIPSGSSPTTSFVPLTGATVTAGVQYWVSFLYVESVAPTERAQPKLCYTSGFRWQPMSDTLLYMMASPSGMFYTPSMNVNSLPTTSSVLTAGSTEGVPLLGLRYAPGV